VLTAEKTPGNIGHRIWMHSAFFSPTNAVEVKINIGDIEMHPDKQVELMQLVMKQLIEKSGL
jgi:hypothetical protein